ncbi:MAG: nucleoside-diphosphate sugar epimerase [Hyphomicrobiales bacterium]|nr:nucleoside-diphosphate sugar epimerase [Hyphomicrobiales bacterium]
MTVTMTRIAILGASGLIGHAVAVELLRQGFDVVPVARWFAASQLSALNGRAFKWALVDAGTEDLARWLTEHRIDVVVNCIGVLQDSARGTAEHVHTGFVDRLIRASQQQPHPVLLIQVSTPGVEEADTTAFSRSKREAERRIRRSGCPFVILRPGFVVAQGAYGGSALVRAIASLPINLPAYESAQPFATVSMADISRTATIVVRRWQKGERDWSATWDVMDLAPTTLGRSHSGIPGSLWRTKAPPMPALMADVARCQGWRSFGPARLATFPYAAHLLRRFDGA